MANSTLPALPLHQLLEALDAWQAQPGPQPARTVEDAFAQVFTAYGLAGAHVLVRLPGLPQLAVGYGTLGNLPTAGQRSELAEYRLEALPSELELGRAWLSGNEEFVPAAARAIELALDAAWSRVEARASERRLAGLDAAVRSIAGVLSVERVLQQIVDRVRELVGVQYAALGIVGPFGVIDRFITSGISDEQRQRIGSLPRGRGLLGLIIREDRSFRIDDIATDPRRFGFPPHHPEMHAFLGVPVRSKERSIGNLYLTNKSGGKTFSESDQRLVEMFALHAGIAIENARLHEEVQRLAVVDERQRISQDLHDGIIQSLYAVTLALEDLPELMADSPAEGEARLERTIEALHETIRDIRNFILGLRPELLDESDLPTSVQSLAAQFRVNTLIDLDLHLDEPREVPPATAAHLLAMTREALSNVARHSGATRASLELREEAGTLCLIIGDNGRGFEVEAARRAHQYGLANLHARAESMGGSLTVTSEPGAGTRLVARVPLAEARDGD